MAEGYEPSLGGEGYLQIFEADGTEPQLGGERKSTSLTDLANEINSIKAQTSDLMSKEDRAASQESGFAGRLIRVVREPWRTRRTRLIQQLLDREAALYREGSRILARKAGIYDLNVLFFDVDIANRAVEAGVSYKETVNSVMFKATKRLNSLTIRRATVDSGEVITDEKGNVKVIVPNEWHSDVWLWVAPHENLPYNPVLWSNMPVTNAFRKLTVDIERSNFYGRAIHIEPKVLG